MTSHASGIVRVAIAGICLVVAGCATYYEPRYSDRGVYYSDPYQTRVVDTYVVNPVYYPFWSVDYFYMSRYRAPYSFYHYPSTGIGFSYYNYYPGWYYGYRAPARFRVGFGYSSWYPWYGHGFHYHHYRPWYPAHHYHHHYHHYARPQVERRTAYRSPERPVRASESHRNQLERQQRQDLAARQDFRGGERELVATQRQRPDRDAIRMSPQQRSSDQRAVQRTSDRRPAIRSAPQGTGSEQSAPARQRAPVREQRSEGIRRPPVSGSESRDRSTQDRSGPASRPSAPTRQAPPRQSSPPSRESSSSRSGSGDSAPSRSRSGGSDSNRGSRSSSSPSTRPQPRSSGRSSRQRDRER